MAIKAYLDSDVVISSLISAKGAAYILITHKDLELFISNSSLEEQERVIERLGLDKKKWNSLVINKFYTIKLKALKSQHRYDQYVSDPNDAHILAGAKQAKAKFLITYNMKHFKVELIKKDLKINMMTPAIFLQYLRSLN
ncbi:MAG: PIN domain-containing protein [bacterium]|nr:PIN domain-containing protein [bacterium]